MLGLRNGGGRGFSLIELLITIMLIGIIAAIAIPNLITAIQRGKQKKTMADIRNIGTALEEYSADEDSPPAGTGTVNAALNGTFFVPFYIKVCPTIDNWGFALNYDQTGAFTGGTGVWSYSIYSYGRWNADDLAASYGEYDIKSFHLDIYFSDGRFTCMPGHK